MAERSVRNAEAVGSNPITSTKPLTCGFANPQVSLCEHLPSREAPALPCDTPVVPDADPRPSFVAPPDFVRERGARGGAQARAWLRGLPELVDHLVGQWSLSIDPARVMHGEFAVVVPVHRAGEPLVLKVSQLTKAVASEASALAAWGGHGAVRLVAADPDAGALLLERLDARRSLFDVELEGAAEIAGAMLRRLAAVTAPAEIPRLRDLGPAIGSSLSNRNERLGAVVPKMWVDTAAALAVDLARDSGDLLIHADLHYGNILGGVRSPWLAIDPRPVAGDPELAVPELLWTRLDEVGPGGCFGLLREIARSGSLDEERARGWSIVRAVDYWLWGAEHGLTEDPKRCSVILEALAGSIT